MFNPIKAFLVALLVAPFPATADSIVLYCVEKHTVGMRLDGSEWAPTYGNEEIGRRYAIHFSEGMTAMTGFHGGDTVFDCERSFPTRARDIVSCTNRLVETMVFIYSTETERFLVTLVGPGGWLGEGTAREEGREPIFNRLIMGECQAF